MHYSSGFVSLSLRYVNLCNLIKSHMNNLTLDPYPRSPLNQSLRALNVLTQYSILSKHFALSAPFREKCFGFVDCVCRV